MNKKLIWLDDYRNPMDYMPRKDNKKITWLEAYNPTYFDEDELEVIWAKSYNEFKDIIISEGVPIAVCFDHDLGEDSEPYNGYDCAKWLINYCVEHNEKLPFYSIQSSNPVGKENITKYFINFMSTDDGKKLTRKEEERDDIFPELDDNMFPEFDGYDMFIKQITELTDKYNSEHDKYVRLQADFQNYKRNMDNKISSMQLLASRHIIIDFLPILDDLRRSIESGNEGNTLILKKALEVLKNNGVEEYGEVGDTFDSDLHNCIMLGGTNEDDDNTIVTVVKNGYRLNGEIIRHADVIVKKS